MKKSLLLLCLGFLLTLVTIAQTPQGFKYQAEVRNAEGTPLAEQSLNLRITLESTSGGTVHFTEVHDLTTNQFGLISIVIGDGAVTYGTLSGVPWENGNITLKAEIKLDGAADFSTLGQSVLYPVPYALYAASGAVTPGTLGQTLNHDGTTWVANSNIFNANANVGIGTVTPTEKLEVMGNIKANGKLIGDIIEINQATPFEEPIFVVRNSLGKIVFAVYESGVRMYVDDTGKGNRGGFAVGGFSDQIKDEGKEYFRVTPDSVRVSIRSQQNGKGNRGGFAVGGFSDQIKSQPQDLLFITPDSARIYIDTQNKKGNRGGFAVGGFSDQIKEGSSNFLDLTPENYFIGHEAGKSITTGKYNSFFGYNAGKSNTEGKNGIFIGYKAGENNTEGDFNVFLGNHAGFSNTSGTSNVFIGDSTGRDNTSGSLNIFMGSGAGQSNLDGDLNVFMSQGAGYQNTSGSRNIFLGTNAGHSNTTGSLNTFIGVLAGTSNTKGNANVFIGQGSGYFNEEANNNIFIGQTAGVSNRSGHSNIFIGTSTGYLNLEGSSNVFIGKQAGYSNKGHGNVFIGEHAGYFNKDGSGNVYIGEYAGGYNEDGIGNVFIGRDAGLTEEGSNKLYISNSDTSTPLIGGDFATNRVGINRMPTALAFEVDGEASKSTAGAWVANSDKRIKTNVSDIADAYQTILKIRPVTFKYTSEWISKNPNIVDKVYYNFIAQEYKEVFPESVQGSGEYLDGDSEEILQLDSYNAQIVSIKAIQELILENTRQQKEIDTLKAEIEAIKALINK